MIPKQALVTIKAQFLLDCAILKIIGTLEEEKGIRFLSGISALLGALYVFSHLKPQNHSA